MDKYNIKNLVFSSSANIYGLATKMPITELTPKGPTNPYGETKLMVEKILEDLVKTNNSWNITSLRYFNPVGAHFSGQIGEDPNGTPTNLLPFITQVALGKLNELKIYGNDYNTPDGTCIRDFIHVTDLAKAHIAALKNMNHPNIYKAYNIGTGKGTSILEAVNTFMEATGKNVNYKFSERRDQDIVVSYADATLANSELSWKANLSFKEACRDSWKWQSENPNGYKK
jgi:UDP-glucose 4-epimerase